MATIFDGFDKISDREMCEQLATLETVTIRNIMSVYGTKAHDKVADTVNFIGSFFCKREVMNKPQVKEIDEIIRECVEELECEPRNRLEARLKKTLSERCGVRDKDVDEEKLSIAVVDRAADYFAIDRILSPAEKVDAVFSRYMERMYKKIHEQLKKQTSKEKRESIRIMDEDIAAMSETDRENMRQALQVDRLTGETIYKILVTTGGTTLFLGAATGFGSYLALTTVMHAVFTTAMGITLPFAAYTGAASIFSILTGPIGWILLVGMGIWQFKSGASKVDGEILSMTVFLARVAYQKSFVAADDALPSWIPTEDITAREEREKQEALYFELQKDYKIKEEQCEKERRKRSEAERAEADAKNRLTQERAREEEAHRKLVEIQREKERLERIVEEKDRWYQEALLEGRKVSEEGRDEERIEVERLKRECDSARHNYMEALRDIETYEEIIAEAEQSQEQASNDIKRLQQEKKDLQERCDALEERLASAENIFKEKQEKRENELKRTWENYFRSPTRRAEYQPNFINAVAKKHYDMIADVERKMIEIFDAKNPAMYADRGRMNTKEKTFHASVRKKYRLHYLYSIDNDTVIFVCFCSHNYQDKRF